jgi:uncharacterized protein
MMSAVSQPARSTSSRIAALDILRGIAILGTLGTNIWVFSAAGTPLVDAFIQTRLSIQSIVEVFCNGKFLSLLAMLFGVGVAIQYEAAQRRGQEWPGRYLWRSTLLFLEGLFHFTLLFEGDVLMGYAVVAVLVAYLLRYSNRVLYWVMGIATGLHVLFITLIVVAIAASPSVANDDAGMRTYATLLASDQYLGQVLFRLSNPLTMRAEPIFALPYTTILFLTGVLLYRNGMFTMQTRATTQQRSLLVWGIGVGLPLNILSVLPTVIPGAFNDATMVLLFLVMRYGCSAILSLGYIGLILHLLNYPVLDWLWNRLSMVGRTALSTYISQSIILSLLFYGWGFGLGSKLSDLWIVGIWLVVAVIQIIIARYWVLHGGGPFERIRKRLERIGEQPAQ